MWTIPALSGLLIVAALVTNRIPATGAAGDWLMVAAAVVAGAPILRKALRALSVKVVGIDLLVSVAAIGAVVIGEYWEAAAVTFLFAVGHALEAATLAKTRSALAELVAVAPDVAVVLRDGEQVEVPASGVRLGEVVLVKHGAKVPVDGEIVAGVGALDEAAITGESIPAEKGVGDQVYAGTLSQGGLLQVRATGVGADTTLARIIHRVEEAQDAKARTQQFMDRFSAWYTPGIIALSLLVGLATSDVVLALTLLVVACPGALVISIPVSIVAGIGRAAKDGILIKGGEYLETSARIDVVAVDKTGTLTYGRPRLADVVPLAAGLPGYVEKPALPQGCNGGEVQERLHTQGNLDAARADVLRWAARAEAGSEHPLARPILEAAAEEGIATPTLPEHAESVPGKGIVAEVEGRRVLVGNTALLDQYAVADPRADRIARDLAEAGRTPMIVALDDTVLGVIAVADEIRPDAAGMIAELHRSGVRRVVMLTGDARPVAEAVAAATGVDEVHAALLPEDKLAVITDLQRQGHTVAMVGDGVNDAPALATAHIGVAMGAAGSAVAVETADIALMGDRLLRLPDAIRLARRTVGTMRQNVSIALVTVALLLAGVLFGGVTMAVGMLVHEASVLVVIVNAMRLLRPTRSPAPVASRTSIDSRKDAREHARGDAVHP